MFTLQDIVNEALEEDIRTGDITSLSTISSDKQAKAKIIFKDQGIISGQEVAKLVFESVDKNTKYKIVVKDGDLGKSGDIAAYIEGSAISILSAERVALNFLQHLSGVATLTNSFQSLINHTRAKILDTRKTTPLLRDLEKQAVVDGGGKNHRIGLYDQVLIKENHIRQAGSIKQAVEKVRAAQGEKVWIEIECTNLEEVAEAISVRVNRILLDNMSLSDMREAVKFSKGVTPLEASGNVNLETVKDIAETGVDFISVGALTHSAPILDLSLLTEL